MSTPRYQTVLAQLTEQVRRNAEDILDIELEAYDSPIEKVFLATMFAYGWNWTCDFSKEEIAQGKEALRDAGLMGPRDNDVSGIRTRMYLTRRSIAQPVCATQARIRLMSRDIRPDFAFVIGGEHATKLIVELDGHDFHERTPDQAQSDKSRDRELQAMGWQVMRFTGREVLQDPTKCYFEVGGLLHAKTVAATHAAKAGS